VGPGTNLYVADVERSVDGWIADPDGDPIGTTAHRR